MPNNEVLHDRISQYNNTMRTITEILVKALLAAALLLLPALNCAHAAGAPAWPDRVFAPYMYLGSGDNFKLTDCDDACGLKHYTLAFIIARQEGRGKDAKYLKEPSWYGRIPVEENFYHDQIDAIRKRGGDVIVSFGGATVFNFGVQSQDV